MTYSARPVCRARRGAASPRGFSMKIPVFAEAAAAAAATAAGLQID
ncbi:hypothetical protein CFter6_3560 [Collimonas fungivorans]|uniref:Uncharacterized protein n=1 Tax=Collimonas fungivorans TaxID=158899 RepID=A0A127PEQ6_9BURK|nr:hypothetical protein CFter6_3560 [Collimonas fungivorans]